MFTFSVSTDVLNREFRKVSPAAGDCSRPLVCDSRYYFLTQKVWCHVWFNLRTISLTPAALALISSLILPSCFLCSISEWQCSADSEDAWTVRGPVATSVRRVPGVAKRWVYSASRSCEFHPVRLSSPSCLVNPPTNVRRRTTDNMILTPGPDWLWPGGLQDARGILWATTEWDDSQRAICKA